MESNALKQVYEEELKWEGEVYHGTLYACREKQILDGLSPVTQVQAVCFSGDKVVLYRDYKDRYGLPGGTVEEGESYHDTLHREVREEAGVTVTNAIPIGYVEVYPQSDPFSIFYQLRFSALVTFSDGDSVEDPDGKAVDRVLVNSQFAPQLLGWGEKGEILIRMAEDMPEKLKMRQ